MCFYLSNKIAFVTDAGKYKMSGLAYCCNCVRHIKINSHVPFANNPLFCGFVA